MALSIDITTSCSAYDGLTNFTGGPDLPWVLETYEELDDCTLRNMIWAFSYAWAAGQRAAGYYHGNVECLAQSLFAALPTWDNALPRESKRIWLQRLGVDAILAGTGTPPNCTRLQARAANRSDLGCTAITPQSRIWPPSSGSASLNPRCFTVSVRHSARPHRCRCQPNSYSTGEE